MIRALLKSNVNYLFYAGDTKGDAWNMKNRIDIKKLVIWLISAAFIIGAVIVAIIFRNGSGRAYQKYNDGVNYIDPETIQLSDSSVTVSFSEVILSKPEETRKLVVYEQSGEVSYTITDKLWGIDWDQTTKTLTVKYTGKGSFVVELDQIAQGDIIDDQENKILTIKIPHPQLDAIDINPDEVEIGNQTSGFFTIGDIKLTVEDYIDIESELRRRLVEKFDTVVNGQQADDLALDAVYDVYYPVVQAVDGDYELKIEFR